MPQPHAAGLNVSMSTTVTVFNCWWPHSTGLVSTFVCDVISRRHSCVGRRATSGLPDRWRHCSRDCFECIKIKKNTEVYDGRRHLTVRLYAVFWNGCPLFILRDNATAPDGFLRWFLQFPMPIDFIFAIHLLGHMPSKAIARLFLAGWFDLTLDYQFVETKASLYCL